MKKLLCMATVLALLAPAAPAFAQAPLRATVLGSQPRILVKTRYETKCLDLGAPEKTKAELSEERLRTYATVGAVIGGVVLAAATQNYSTVTSASAQLAATGAGMLGGGYVGKKVAEATAPRKAWAFDDVAEGASAPRSNCSRIEIVDEVQDGFTSLVRIRNEDRLVLTEKALTPGAVMRAFTNASGELELVP